jgi:hypothetical protein
MNQVIVRVEAQAGSPLQAIHHQCLQAEGRSSRSNCQLLYTCLFSRSKALKYL